MKVRLMLFIPEKDKKISVKKMSRWPLFTGITDSYDKMLKKTYSDYIQAKGKNSRKDIYYSIN
jgi:hypothetical protein